MHVFSFCSIMDLNNNITPTDVTPDLLRLSRCVDDKYLLPFDHIVKQGGLLQTYENIIFASSIEGTAMVAIGKESNSAFIQNLHQHFNRQYLLIYLLVLIQRYTLQSIEQKIPTFEPSLEQDKQNDDKLWNLINVICRIKTNCYYTDVSIYTHHSQFYHLCCKNMHVPETFEEINGKIELLKSTIGRKIQKALEEQKEQNESSLALLRIEEQKAERRQHILNWTIGILTTFQVTQASYELIDASKIGNALTKSLIIGIACVLLLCLIMRKDIIQFIKSNFNNK